MIYTNPEFYNQVEQFHAKTGKDLKKAGKWAIVFFAAMFLLVFITSCGKSYEVRKENGDTITTYESVIGNYSVGDSVKVSGVNAYNWQAHNAPHVSGVYGQVIKVNQ